MPHGSDLLVCAAIFVVATLLAVLDARVMISAVAGATAADRSVRRRAGRRLPLAAGLLATHGDPFAYINRQLNKTTQVPTTKISHFAVAGT